MRTILLQAGTLATNTVRDIIRQPVILLLTTTAVVLIGLLPSTAVFAFGEEARLVRDGALALNLVFGLLVAGAAAAATIYAEIKRGTAATVLCKPVSRSLYFISTYIGVLMVLLLFCATTLLAGLLSLRMVLPGMQTDGRIGALFLAAVSIAFGYAAISNFMFRRQFVSQAFIGLLPCLMVAFVAAAWIDPNGHAVRFGSLMAWQMVPAGILVSLAVMVLAALAVSLSTRLPPVLSTSACAAVFFLGLVSDYLLRAAAATSWWAASIYRLLPNWQDFWIVDALSGGGNIPWGYVAASAGYAGLYAVAALALGVLSFRRVEIL
ncbi:MAG: hypothetical protein WC381_05885 [Kiritimatiellia bacterium]|jgi:ABC-type transport system involved in multi-copper enzyme maturation permease subunit